MTSDFHMPDSWYDPPDENDFDPSCPDCGEDSLTVEGDLVSCMECEYSNYLEPDYDEYDDVNYDYDFEEEWSDDES